MAGQYLRRSSKYETVSLKHFFTIVLKIIITKNGIHRYVNVKFKKKIILFRQGNLMFSEHWLLIVTLQVSGGVCMGFELSLT